MTTNIEVTKATALMIEAMQKRYEAVCLAIDAIEFLCGVSDEQLKENAQKAHSEDGIKAHWKIYNKQAEELCDKIYESSWGFENALWQLFCDMARDRALGDVKEGKIFTHI